MFKTVIFILFIFNVLACEPITKTANKGSNQQAAPFTCLSSQSKCQINAEYGHFIIQFSGQAEQGRIKTELPFKIKVRFVGKNENYQLKNVVSHLEGKSMYMGEIPVFFQTDKELKNVLIAETLLASCSEDVMAWLLWLQFEISVDGETKRQSGFINFDSQRL